MRSILLSPGPSLSLYHGEGADLTIAVNRAALHYPCDVWACLDWTCQCADGTTGGFVAWSEWVQESATLLTNGLSEQAARGRGFDWPSIVTTETLGAYCPPSDTGYRLYSATCALVYAGSVGCDRITCYGVDMAGTLDWDGTAAGENRTEDRWARERTIWTDTVRWLGDHGVTVERKSECTKEHVG